MGLVNASVLTPKPFGPSDHLHALTQSLITAVAQPTTFVSRGQEMERNLPGAGRVLVTSMDVDGGKGWVLSSKTQVRS